MNLKYDLEKQVHSLSLMSNMCFGAKGTPEVLQDYATKTVDDMLANEVVKNDILGDYQAIWGPVVWSNKEKGTDTVCDNNMFLAYREDTNQYVLAIAGTNIDSLYGWLVEDFRTYAAIDWHKVSPTAPKNSGKIAQGTNEGLQALLTKMKDSNRGNVTLLDFLKEHMATAKPGAGFSVGGHSLGGTLTPVTATYLINTKSDWDPESKIAQINAYPTAGATPGGKNFKAYVENLFTNENVYKGKYNGIDVVPHGWQKDMLQMVPGLYAPQIPKPKLVSLATKAAILMSERFHYQQITPFQKMDSEFVTPPAQEVDDLLSKVPKSVKALFKLLGLSLEDHIKFLIELGIQHVPAYNILLGIEWFATIYNKYVSDNKPSPVSMEDVVAGSLDKLVNLHKDELEEIGA